MPFLTGPAQKKRDEDNCGVGHAAGSDSQDVLGGCIELAGFAKRQEN